MSRRRLTIIIATFTGLIAQTNIVVAQSENRELITGLESQLLFVAFPLTLFVLTTLLYATVNFHNNSDPQPTTENPTFEISWTITTVLILLFVGISAYSVLASPYISPLQPDTPTGGGDEGIEEVDRIPETSDEELVVRGYQWGWEMTYPQENVTTQNDIVIPANEDVTIWLTSDNVIHSLFISDLGIKQDAFPGEYTRVRTIVYETGHYDAVCTEFCGAGHSKMDANVIVVNQETYNEWLEEHADEEDVAPPSVS